MRRTSILGMMAGVGLIAVGLAALRNADQLWQAVAVTLTLAALGVASMGARQLDGADRAWWGGFAAFGWGYLILSSAPWVGDQVGPIMLPGYLLRAAHESIAAGSSPYYERLAASREDLAKLRGWLANPGMIAASEANPSDPTRANVLAEIKVQESMIASLEASGPPPTSRWPVLFPGINRRVEFARIGHSLSALASGWFGAAVSRRMWSRRRGRSSWPAQGEGAPVETASSVER
jgi:hypothetical protein